LKYHCLVGVAIRTARNKDPGKFYLKYFLQYNERDVNDVKKAITMSENKIWKTSLEEALHIHKKSELISTLNSMILASQANDASIHHFTSDYKFDEEHIASIVELANTHKYYRDLLDQSRIR
jgi:hypothetical protein